MRKCQPVAKPLGALPDLPRFDANCLEIEILRLESAGQICGGSFEVVKVICELRSTGFRLVQPHWVIPSVLRHRPSTRNKITILAPPALEFLSSLTRCAPLRGNRSLRLC